MRLCSITPTSNREALIGDALRSVVDWVDVCLLLDLGITDRTLEVAKEVAGDKLKAVKVPGELMINFCDVRNFGLDEAAKEADWGVLLDTDERLYINGTDVRGELGKIGDGIVLVQSQDKHYPKERFVSLPAIDRYVGKVHETIVPLHAKQSPLPGVVFLEIQKTPEELKAKLEYILPLLEEETRKDPQCPRWWYYLGDTLEGLGRRDDAIAAFDRCSVLRGWDEESAWACFRMAILLENSGRRQDAIDICCAGLARHPGIAELAWLAGEVSLRLGWNDKAVYWARMAVANGTNHGEGHFIKPRIGFRYDFAAKEGPFDVMARAYETLGMAEEAASAKKIYEALRGDK
jgi:tetratricopeptide (TPR) repeat protein